MYLFYKICKYTIHDMYTYSVWIIKPSMPARFRKDHSDSLTRSKWVLNKTLYFVLWIALWKCDVYNAVAKIDNHYFWGIVANIYINPIIVWPTEEIPWENSTKRCKKR